MLRDFLSGPNQKYRPYLVIGAIALVCFLMVLFCSRANAAEFWKQKRVRFSAVAGENLATGDVVCIKADGLAWKADADAATLRPAVGVIGKPGDAGENVEVIVTGIMGGNSAGTVGGRLFLGTTAGAFTQTPPDNEQPLGVELSGGDYLILIQLPDNDGAGY